MSERMSYIAAPIHQQLKRLTQKIPNEEIEDSKPGGLNMAAMSIIQCPTMLVVTAGMNKMPSPVI